ncbi:MAG: glycosyltransferase, partial [Verrucomicrobia bacterium]|nr:glycosyltransferase [Verrucomicrobiota bacterium]
FSATIVHLCLSLVMVFNLKAVSHISFDWWNVLWIFPVISMVSGLPISIGGAGLREGTALILLGIYAIPGEDAVTASLLTLGVYFLWAFIGLIVWQLEEMRQQKTRPLPVDPSVSIIIPTLNEENKIHALAAHLQLRAPDAEWILADGGSTDGTLDKAKHNEFKTISCPKGRGTQMHHGANAAKGDVILFLHADTLLPPDGITTMLRCLKDAHVAAGGFWKQFDKPHWIMSGSRFRCLPRIFFGKYVFGDQGIFVRRNALIEMGGVPKVPLMEEFELCQKLRKQGRIALADATVTTSSRRFFTNGIIKTYLLMGRIMLRYKFGQSPESLAQAYARSKSK